MNNLTKNLRIHSNGTMDLTKKIKGTFGTKTSAHPVRGEELFSNSRPAFQLKTDKMIRFMRPLADFLDQIKVKPQLVSSGFSSLLNHNIRHALKRFASDYKIDFSQLIVSRGDLPNAPGISVSSPKDGRLVFRWTDNSGIGKARASDLVFIAVFNRESKRWIYVVDTARRSAQHCKLDVSSFRFKKVQTYFGLISEYGTRISTSVYVGEVHVS